MSYTKTRWEAVAEPQRTLKSPCGPGWEVRALCSLSTPNSRSAPLKPMPHMIASFGDSFMGVDAKANAQRAAACVNACAGMADPGGTLHLLVDSLAGMKMTPHNRDIVNLARRLRDDMALARRNWPEET